VFEDLLAVVGLSVWRRRMSTVSNGSPGLERQKGINPLDRCGADNQV
jgi:hypothetical protein